MIKAFIISLPTAYERRASIRAMLLRGNIEFEILDAKYGKDLAGREREFCKTLYCARAFRDLSLNEIACSLGHKMALERFLESDSRYGLILEDDANIQPVDFERLLPVVQSVPPFDLLKVGGFGGPLRGWVASRLCGVSVMAVLSPTVSSHGYVVTKNGAGKLASTILPVREPYDAFLRNVHVHKCTLFETAPWLVGNSEHATHSSIGGTRQRSRTTSSSLEKTLRSAAFRLRYNVMKRVFNFRRFGLAYITRSGFTASSG